jgi:DNA-binding transcriptional LysR family regulator
MTELGEAYYERCKRVLAEVEGADLMVEQLQSEPRGTWKVSAPMSFGVSHVGSVVSGFLSEYGDLSVSLTLNDRFTDLIEEGFDVAIRISESADTSLIARRLGIIRCLMTATPDYLERMGAPTKPQDLSNHQCLSYIYLASGREWVMFGPNGATSVKVSGLLKANNGEVLLQVARQGLGIAFLPNFLVRDEIDKGHLVPVLEGYRLPELSVYAVSPPNRFPARKVQAFITFLAERFEAADF